MVAVDTKTREATLAMANDIQNATEVHAGRELWSWNYVHWTLIARNCDCADCGRDIRLSRLAAEGYHARYMELMGVE